MACARRRVRGLLLLLHNERNLRAISDTPARPAVAFSPSPCDRLGACRRSCP
jgi:hypothetical protein